MIQAFRKNTWLGPYLQKKSGPVTGQNSLDAELGGCGMLLTCVPGSTRACVNNEHQWMCLSFTKCIFRWNALQAGGPLPSPPTRPVVCGWLVARVCEALWSWGGQVVDVSNGIDCDQQAQ